MKTTQLRILAALLAVLFCWVWIPAIADEEVVMIPVDSVNGTRWENTLVLYQGRETTEQNEWGYNVVVDASGKVIEKIPAGDIRGKQLTIPEGGMVISGTDDKGKNLYNRIEVGDNVLFDVYGSRILAAKGEINPFYTQSITVTDYNAPRYSNTLVLYNQAGTRTGTNGYGYEVTVDRNGYIVATGGNDSLVPEGGYVLSAIEPADRDHLKIYFIMGARCKQNGNTITVTYDASMLASTVQQEVASLNEQLQEAKTQLRLIDYQQIEAQLAEVAKQSVTTFAERDAALAQLNAIGRQMIERRTVEVRSTWYTPLETNAEEVQATVAAMREAGLNQVCLGITPAMLKLSKEFPYAPGDRVASFDILGEYVTACKQAGIELVITMTVFYNKNPRFSKWLTHTNQGTIGEETFCSPANEEFISYFKEYLTYLVTRYAIDGLQFDYIRFPYFDGTTDYGYDNAMKDLFAAETGCNRSVVDEIAEQLSAHVRWNEWVNFKTNLITRRVAEFSAIIRELRPDLYISAAVADHTVRSAYCQDSSVWLDKGYVDGIYPMSYAEGIMQPSTIKFHAYIKDARFLVMGNGAYMSLTMDEMYRQTRDSALYGSDGIAYFEWGAYRDHGYAAQLASDLLAEPALSFTYSEQESISALLQTAARRFALDTTCNGSNAQTEWERLKTLHGEDAVALLAALQEIYPGQDALLQDVELAARIQTFSRAAYKGTVELLPVITGSSVTDPSGSQPSEPVSTDSKPNSQNPEVPQKQGTPWGLLLGIAAGVVVLAGAAACVLLRKRKS